MTDIDPRFRQMGRRARQRRRRAAGLRAGMAGAVICVLAGGLFWQWGDGLSALWREAVDDARMTQVEQSFDIAPVTRGDGFTDIPGDPMIIPRDTAAAPVEGRTVVAPEALRLIRAATRSELTVVETGLAAADRQLVAALPSTREEFAMFQAERSRARRVAEATGSAGTATSPANAATVSGTLFLRPAGRRPPLYSDTIVEVAAPREIGGILAANGLGGPAAEREAARATAALDLDGTVPAGSVLAVRHRQAGGGPRIIQLSLYGPTGFIGAAGLSAAGQLVPAADAWADQQILSDLLARNAGADSYKPQRLLDALYSAALRAGLDPERSGQAIAMMARIHDLDGYSDPDDRVQIMRERVSGELVFMGIAGPSGAKTCYVVPGPDGEPGCLSAAAAPAEQAAEAMALVPPVAGVVSQRFVPPAGGDSGGDRGLRGHVTWSAQQGGPVRAAGSGRVTALTLDPVHGAGIEIRHDARTVTRYRGLGAIDPDLREGATVAAGDRIGTVGIPPGLRQPGLVFQLESGGVPADPSRRLGGVIEVPGSLAVEGLIAQIIRVESGGNVRARNPLSSASGLGQFIESTWLRMIRSYRPDLLANLSRGEVLDLRFNAELSREMVRHLAQENEAYLRARGHQITAGRLYLAHFLGPAGADLALRADPGQSVLSAMGTTVVNANPFLRGYSIADLRSWAERKMNRGAGAVAVAVPDGPPVSPEIRDFMAAIDQIRGTL